MSMNGNPASRGPDNPNWHNEITPAELLQVLGFDATLLAPTSPAGEPGEPNVVMRLKGMSGDGDQAEAMVMLSMNLVGRMVSNFAHWIEITNSRGELPDRPAPCCAAPLGCDRMSDGNHSSWWEGLDGPVNVPACIDHDHIASAMIEALRENSAPESGS